MDISLEEYHNISKSDLLLNHKKILKHTTQEWAMKELSFELVKEFKKKNCTFGFINNIYNILLVYKTWVFLNEENEIKGFVSYRYYHDKVCIEYFQSFEKGFGRKIFEYFKKNININDIVICNIVNNSHKFWEKMGFKIIHEDGEDIGII